MWAVTSLVHHVHEVTKAHRTEHDQASRPMRSCASLSFSGRLVHRPEDAPRKDTKTLCPQEIVKERKSGKFS